MKVKSIFFALVFLILGIVLIVSQWSQLGRMTEQPVRVKLPELKEKYKNEAAYWVMLEGGAWDCQSIYTRGSGRSSQTKILYRNSGDTAVYAKFTGLRDCNEIRLEAPTGTVQIMNNRMLLSAIHENERFLQPSSEMIFFELCTFCSPTNSKGGIVIGGILVILGLGIVANAWRDYQKNKFYWSLMRKQHL